MCALSPSPTEAHAGTLLFLRSDGPLYNCTRATALWLSSGGPGAAKRKCPSLPQSSQFKIKTGVKQAWLNTKPKAHFLSISAVMLSKEVIHPTDTTVTQFLSIQCFSLFLFFLPSSVYSCLFALSTLQPLLSTTFTHVPTNQISRCFRPLFYYVLNKHHKGSVSLF